MVKTKWYLQNLANRQKCFNLNIVERNSDEYIALCKNDEHECISIIAPVIWPDSHWTGKAVNMMSGGKSGIVKAAV